MTCSIARTLRRWYVLHADQLRLGAAMKLAFAAILAYGTLNATVRDQTSLPVAVLLVAESSVKLMDELGHSDHVHLYTDEAAALRWAVEGR